MPVKHFFSSENNYCRLFFLYFANYRFSFLYILQDLEEIKNYIGRLYTVPVPVLTFNVKYSRDHVKHTVIGKFTGGKCAQKSCARHCTTAHSCKL